MMKRDVHPEPPSSLIAYELAPGQVLFVQELPSIPKIDALTESEQDVLELLLNNYDTATISETRSTSPRTTANHIASIFKKLGVGSRAELAAKIASMSANV
jgi:DNA-binding NarL/FixJ family response regulator